MFSPVVTKGGFKFIEQTSIDVLGVQVQHYEQQKIGAKHYHLACGDSNKSFMVALRTLPIDSTGVAHILEHLVLCGSSRYPVRDPFFLMIRRSLSNFMNAFTASDWTAYPFSTQNEKDFYNLLQVYLDAVFFPNLEELDFKQEGWRLHIESPGEQAILNYKGVVFNEMKGAMSSPTRQLWHHLCRHLFSTESTYHYNSGGEPLEIPSLTHQQLLDFHQCYYHPSNAVFFSYGDLDPATLQEKIESSVLYAFDKKVTVPVLDNDTRFSPIKNVVECYPMTEKKQTNATHIVMAWRLDFNSLDIEDLLQANLLNLLLFDNASSPMQKLLEESSLGTSPSQINGLEDDLKEMVMVIGLEGCDENAQSAVSELIINELQRLKHEGIAESQVEACIHQLELAQRDISGGSMPTGLNLFLSVTLPAIHGADITGHLDLEAPLYALRQKSKNPDFIKSLIARLADNKQHLCLKMSPDETLHETNLAKEKQQLSNWKKQLDIAQQHALKRDNIELEKRQLEPQNVDILPTISIQDIKPECSFLQADEKKDNYAYYQTRCNGLVYVNAVMNLPSIPVQQCVFLPLLSALMSEVGTQKKSYLTMQHEVSRYTGGISIKPHYWQPIGHLSEKKLGKEKMSLQMVMSGMSLFDHVNKLFALMTEILSSPRFDERAHIKECITQLALSTFYAIASNGHIFSMQAAASYFSVAPNIGLEWSGLSAIKRLLEIKNRIQSEDEYDLLVDEIQHLYATLSQQWQSQWLLIADAKNQTPLIDSFKQTSQHTNDSSQEEYSNLIVANKSVHQYTVWGIESEVNYCAMAYPVADISHPDCAIFHVLANYLRNVYLHTAIREQGGAYGGGCQYDSLSGIFHFFSYRDPRLHETFADFNSSITKMMTAKIKARDIQEAIFNAVSKIDAPVSPPDTVKQDFYASLKGINKAFRENYKQKLLNVKAEDLRRVVTAYFIDQPHSKAVITGHKQAEKLEKSEDYKSTFITL